MIWFDPQIIKNLLPIRRVHVLFTNFQYRMRCYKKRLKIKNITQQ